MNSCRSPHKLVIDLNIVANPNIRASRYSIQLTSVIPIYNSTNNNYGQIFLKVIKTTCNNSTYIHIYIYFFTFVPEELETELSLVYYNSHNVAHCHYRLTSHNNLSSMEVARV